VVPNDAGTDYWTLTPDEALDHARSRPDGLTDTEAAARLLTYGPNHVRARRPLSRARVFVAQLRSPLLLLLLFAAAVSGLTGAWMDAGLVFVIVAASVGIGYWREYAAQGAAEALELGLRTHTTVIRLGRPLPIPVDDVVPGDVVQLAAGSLVPGDGVVLNATDFFVSEAVLTGESFPVEKQTGVSPANASVAARTNCVFLGTNVRSGNAKCLIVRTGMRTEFGAIAGRLKRRPPTTEFDRGMQQFGYLLTVAMLIMVLLVFGAHVIQGRPPIETLLFAVALAVGLSPELLPAILSVNLARGAQLMARAGVLVRRLNAIENLGSMDVLCTDKTGTLTEGVVRLEGAYDAWGRPSPEVLHVAALNAALETGLVNPLDQAILAADKPELAGVEKLAEVPFDFVRKRVSVIVRQEGTARLITKGAFPQILELCTRSLDGRPLGPSERRAIAERHDRWAVNGIRVLAVAVRSVEGGASIGREAESDLAFAGFVTFLDRPKDGAKAAIGDLGSLGVTVKLISGDTRLVVAHVAALVGMRHQALLTGQELRELNDEALWHAAARTDVFAEVDPIQKERIIRALRSSGHVVGFLGDGVNDAPAMHAADTSLCVSEAADVAREAADFVLLERDLDVIRQGIVEGRRTFANTLKYILTTTSANLGNMVSMAVVSLFLPFLPLTAGQILLNNFLSDIPAIGLAGDRVDRELVDTPQRWNMRFVARFMVEFGVLSSAFDALTFATLLLIFATSTAVFRTGWFVESLLTELVIALVVRTRRPFYRSRPGKFLLVSTAALVIIALILPYVPAAAVLGFTPLPLGLLVVLCTITAAYVAAAEVAKRWFFRVHAELPASSLALR
jgi:Mg2+-importing ATPase